MKIWKREIAGREFFVEHGRVAKQANGAVMARIGETTVLATVVMADSVTEGIDFVPLTVEFQERFLCRWKNTGRVCQTRGQAK